MREYHPEVGIDKLPKLKQTLKPCELPIGISTNKGGFLRKNAMPKLLNLCDDHNPHRPR